MRKNKKCECQIDLKSYRFRIYVVNKKSLKILLSREFSTPPVSKRVFSKLVKETMNKFSENERFGTFYEIKSEIESRALKLT